MPTYRDVSIIIKSGHVIVDPEIAEVYFDWPAGPDSVRWTVKGEMPTGANRVLIKWDIESPFKDLGCGCDQRNEALVLYATGNLGYEGMYKYTVLFVDDEENILAGRDPKVSNLPQPPAG